MFQKAKWIACEKYETPIIQRCFTLPDFTEADLDITGLGYFEAYLNGRRLTEDLFLPAQTDYHRRDTSRLNYPILDRTHYRIHYLTFPVTRLLHPGENTLEIILGNGWYRQTRRTCEGEASYGDSLKALYEFHVQTPAGDVCIGSDGSELYGETGILESNLYYGEKIDAGHLVRYNQRVKVTDIPNTVLIPQTCPGDRIVSTLRPKLVRREGDTCIYDNGVNVAGFVEVTAHCPAGGTVTVTYSENLNDDRCDLDYRSTGCGGPDGQMQRDVFIGDGRENTFSPKFVYHCFRYFKITGDFQSAVTRVVHTDVPVLSSFTCDNPTLNWLHKAFQRTLLNNLHGCIPSDCPHRERLGYTGDGQLTAEAAMYCFDLSGAYRKWILDIFDGQGENGHIQHTAPLQGGGGGPAGWGGAAITLPFEYYRFYGDKAFLQAHYPHMLRWISYMRSRTEQGLIVREEEGGWCLGDWGTPSSIEIPPAYVNTLYFVYLLEKMRQIAVLLGHTEDAEALERDMAAYKQAALDRYHDPASGDFCGNVQFANVFALAVGLGDERTFAHVCQAIDVCEDVLDIGMIAMDLLIALLFQSDEPDRALRAIELLLGPMIANDSTTVWEYPYRVDRSNCHHMFCGMIRSLFSEMLGVRLHLDGRVERRSPKLPAAVRMVRAKTVLRGEEIRVDYEKDSPCYSDMTAV
ncbi:MAG: family 78 glycoside hydrolase catalytic domain [Clostridiales bacterium]|nr:family 78 glycoside hydrolase catalytic domain [Clostridiales bacterium]